MRDRFPKKLHLCVVLMTAMAVLSNSGCAQMGSSSQASQNSVEPAAPMTESSTAPQDTTRVSYAAVVKRVMPAVVTIQSGRRVRAPQQFPFSSDPRFREFFGERFRDDTPSRGSAPPAQMRLGLGSGVIVSADGYVLTNHHVVDGAEEIKVALGDRRTFDARLVGSDPPSDLAVLKIEAADLPLLSLGDSDKVETGDVALAVGNPLGIGQTVTAGIISAKGRATGVSDGSFEDFLQTDAPINQGNSGGALINTNGELIGINSQIVSPTGGNIGIGFAIPSNMAKNVMDQLIKTGQVRRGQLGITVQAITSDIAKGLSLPEVKGVIVGDVQTDSAAALSGIRREDVIIAFNGEPVNTANDLRNRVASTAPGTEVTLTILRSGKEEQLRATLGEMRITERNNE